MTSAEAVRWRWGVWHPADRQWHEELERRAQQHTQRQSHKHGAVVSAVSDRAQQIPKIIHQVWLGPRPIPTECVEWMKTWRAIHTEWAYRLWTDADVDRMTLVNERAYREASNYGEKSDILRYEVLREYGGVYVDVDMKCIASFDPLVSEYSFIVGISNTGCVEINNAVIASCPQHPILTTLIDKIHQRTAQPKIDTSILAHIAQLGGGELASVLSMAPSASADSPMGTIERTGPGLMTRIFMDAIGWSTAAGEVKPGFLSAQDKRRVTALPIDYFYPLPNTSNVAATEAWPPRTVAVHYWRKTWMTT